MGASIGVIIGVVVLLISIGFVVLMMVSEWSAPAETVAAEADVIPLESEQEASRPVGRPRKARVAARAPSKKKKTSTKKKAAKKKR